MTGSVGAGAAGVDWLAAYHRIMPPQIAGRGLQFDAPVWRPSEIQAKSSAWFGSKTLRWVEYVNADMFARAVQLVLAPVVMISSAAVILNGLLAHYGEVNGRIRAMNRERFDLVHTLAAAPDQLCSERLAEIDHQLPDLLDRHRLIHDAILAIYYAIVVLVLSMLAVAAAALSDIAWLALGVLALLLLGTLVMLYGVLLTTLEIRVGRRSIVYESERSVPLRTPTRPDGGHAGDNDLQSHPRG